MDSSRGEEQEENLYCELRRGREGEEEGRGAEAEVEEVGLILAALFLHYCIFLDLPS